MPVQMLTPLPDARQDECMNHRADSDRWRSARTLADLAKLTVAWLNGEIQETPSHLAPPMPETVSPDPCPDSCQPRWFRTTQSQPGEALDDLGSAQRANVSGFASTDTFARLMAAVADADLIITAARAAPYDDLAPFIAITLDDGEEFTWDGGADSRESIEHGYGHDCPDAVDALCRAWQVTLIDPEWGRNDLLWPLLERFADEIPHG